MNAPLDLSRLPRMTLKELRLLWAASFGRAPPPQRRLLIRELAWRAQEEREGGFDTQTRRLLRAAMRAVSAGDGEARAKSVGGADGSSPARKRRRPSRLLPKLQPAVRLVREWRGRRHEVTVVEDGRAYRYDDRTFRSLSEIAREITGAHWSGPRFFGLVSRTRKTVEQFGGPDRSRGRP